MSALPPALPPAPGPDRVVVHATLRGPVITSLGGFALLALGLAALIDGGPRPFTLGLVATGLGFSLVALLDVPRRAEFDLEGVTRVCTLRRHHLPWSEVVAVERARPSTATVARNAVDRRESSETKVSGGLVARGRGRRRWLLTDQVESRTEHERLAALLDRCPHEVALRAPTPHTGATPSDLYRRGRRRA